MSALAELFPAEDYRFHLALRRGDPAEFFAPTAEHAAIVAERKRWLDTDPSRYAALRPAGVPLLHAMERWLDAPTPSGADDSANLRLLGRRWEPDILLLSPAADGQFILVGGALCFPTSWALEDKMGLPLDAIHAAVPGLNDALDAPIQQFVARLKPGVGYLRSNWGLAATSERNLHPALQRPRLGSPLDPETIWLRVERQMLARIPGTEGLLFGIRIETHPLRTLLADDGLRAGFHRAVRTMPSPLARYKGLAPVQAELLALAAG